MKGTTKKRGKVWRGRADLGIDPTTGKRKMVSVTAPTKKAAGDELRRALERHERGEYVPPAKLTVAQWLETWLAVSIAPHKRVRTVETYRSVLDRHLIPAIGALRLQSLEPEHIETYFAERRETLSGSTLAQHSAILHNALQSALRKKKIHFNPAALVEHKPQRSKSEHEEALTHCWEAVDARRFLDVARASGAQPGAFYSLALELGLRKGELCGLLWSAVELEKGTIRVERQLVKNGNATKGREPLFGPLKRGKIRTLSISAETCALLAAHRKHQAEVKIANRRAYNDRGLVFAKEERVQSAERLGDPLQANNIAEREFNRLTKLAGVKRIKFHGLRHTSATLALLAGVPIKVVQERLGHLRHDVTMDIYAHALPSSHQDAASTMGALLHQK